MKKVLEATDLQDLFSVEIRNISESGVSFSCERALPLNTPLILNLDDYPVHFAVETRIVWQREIDSGRFLHGARFANLEEAERLLLKAQMAALELDKLKAFGLF
jgi:hypothetical protein